MKPHWTHTYEPSRDFLKDLKSLDDKLNVFWDAIDHDWVVVRHGDLGDHEIGHYKFLDNRVLKSLDEGNLMKTTPKKFDEYIEEYNQKIRKEKEDRAKEERMESARRLYVDGGIREHKTQF